MDLNKKGEYILKVQEDGFTVARIRLFYICLI